MEETGKEAGRGQVQTPQTLDRHPSIVQWTEKAPQRAREFDDLGKRSSFWNTSLHEKARLVRTEASEPL